MNWIHRRAGLVRATVGAFGSAAVLVGLTACGGAAQDPQAIVAQPAAATSSADPQLLGSDEYYKITMNITNSTTDTDLVVYDSSLGHENGSDGGHWDQQPADLKAGATETVSAYSAVQGQYIEVRFGVAGSTGHVVTLVATDPAVGDNNTDDTSAATPFEVKASISNGLHCTATFTITD